MTDFNHKLTDVILNKSELNELSKKVKAIWTNGLTKIWWINFKFLMEQNIFLLEYFRII